MPAYRLLPHQEEALNTALPVLARTNKTFQVMACGSGKTILGRALQDRLAVEALGTPGGHTPAQGSGFAPGIRTLPQVAELLDRLSPRPARVRVCVDAVSWAATGAHPEHISAMGHPVRHVRVADDPCPRQLPVRQWWPAHRLMPGAGALPWVSLTTALTQVGPLALAVTNPSIRALPGADLVAVPPVPAHHHADASPSIRAA